MGTGLALMLASLMLLVNRQDVILESSEFIPTLPVILAVSGDNPVKTTPPEIPPTENTPRR